MSRDPFRGLLMRCNSLRNPWDINDGSYAEAYNAATGTKVWSRSILPWYAMVIVNGVVYVQSGLGYPNGQSSVYALDAQTGQTIWNVVLQQNLSSASPAVANGVSLLKNCDMM
jgi:outer membrane protein assembly factor BamB